MIQAIGLFLLGILIAMRFLASAVKTGIRNKLSKLKNRIRR